MSHWKAVFGFEQYYEVSGDGRVRSTLMHCPPYRLNKELSQWKNPGGYSLVTLQVKGKRKHRTVHSLVLEAHVYPRPKGLVSRHINGNKTDNRARNLCWGTVYQNHMDKKRHGTFQEGLNHGNSKLTPAAILDIRASDDSSPNLGRKYGVSRTTIIGIRKGRAWRHVMPQDTIG
jgi:hypothetical protein